MLSLMRVLRSKRVGEFLLSFNYRPRFLCTNLNPPPSTASSLRPAGFLKYAAVSSLTGATAFTAYLSYAYSSDEIEEKTKSIRESAKYTTGDNRSTTLASYTEPYKDKLLPDLPPGEEKHVYTLVLDLDETLIFDEWMVKRSVWQPVKRPGVVDFLEHLSRFYEIVVYTDEYEFTTKSEIDSLDPTSKCIRYTLSRAATKYQDGKHFRDLSKLNRDPAKVIYLSGHAENCLQPENCIPIKPCKKFDKDDTTLLDFIPFLEYVALVESPTDIRSMLQSYRGCDIPTEFIKRSKEHKM
ncbi:hypothetical protein PIB30_056381 [Stylosanthes scabra]|uniref:Mitochondrial import inner membrane translocase subunit TIM50 n=1 Tax=Stylosanthes scabra TaxID=79078 RepID=A0ABU6UI49_9FABA|nr:hypothetical protein [Stylosanthes scabra]